MTATGYVEAWTDSLVSGWAWDSDSPDRRVELVIMCDKDVIAQVCAREYRDDLRRANFGDGRYGFSYVPATPLPMGIEVRVLIAETDVELERVQIALPSAESLTTVGPVPPEALRIRVAGTPDENWFDHSGAMTLREWARLLTLHGRHLSEFETIVEWGCGCGRVSRHLATTISANQKLIGLDVDTEAIAWLAANYPNIQTLALSDLPPSPLSAQSTDLIVSHSVLTHLPEGVANAWLAELARLLKPGGLFITTVHGNRVIEEAKPWISATEFTDIMTHYGFYYHAAKTEAEAPLPEYYGSAFHSIDYIARRWTRWFNIRAWLPTFALSYQDTLLLERNVEQ